jgi:hypothetical protein
LALPAAGSPNPVGTRQTLNWSFWPLSHPINIADSINTAYTSPTTFGMPTTAEETIYRAPGKWSLWQTNVWYRMALHGGLEQHQRDGQCDRRAGGCDGPGG